MAEIPHKQSILILGFYLLVLIAIAWFANLGDVLEAIATLSFSAIIQSSALLILILILSAWSLRLLWTNTGKVPFLSFFRAFLKSWIVAHFLPARVGDYSLATFLPGSPAIGRTAALITLDKMVTVLINLTLLLFLSFAWFHVIDSTSLILVSVICVGGIASLFWEKTRTLYRHILGSHSRIFEGFSSELFHVVRKEPGRVLINAAFTLIRVGLQSLIYWIVLNAVGAQTSLATALFIGVVGQLAVILAFTPNAMGIREPLVVATAMQLGLDSAPVVATILIMHSIEWLHVILIVLALGLTSRPGKSTPHAAVNLNELYLSCGVITHPSQAIAPVAEVVESHHGKPIGVCGIVKRHGFIPTLYLAVDSKHQGKGIGKKLVAQILHDYRGIIFLTVSPQNPAAYHIYENVGFRKVINWRKIRGFPTQVMVKLSI